MLFQYSPDLRDLHKASSFLLLLQESLPKQILAFAGIQVEKGLINGQEGLSETLYIKSLISPKQWVLF